MSIGFLIYVLGHNALYGFGIIVSFMPLNLYCAKVEAKYEVKYFLCPYKTPSGRSNGI